MSRFDIKPVSVTVLIQYTLCVADMSAWPRRWEERGSGAQRGSSERVFVSQVHNRK